MKKTHLNLLSSLLATAGLLLAACVPQPLSQTPPHAGQAQGQRALKGPYTGPVSLKIDTSLMGKTSGKVVDLSRPVAGADFSIQALPTGPIVFQESFSKSSGQLEEVTRRFPIPDVTRRYTLHVLKHEPDKGREGRIQVSLNGSWTVREKDFEGQNLEVMREGLLLSANNSLLLRLRGKAGTRFTVRLVEGGEAGTLLRRRGWEKDADLTQADRLRNNDINWFFPDDPSSLGGLQPYEGDQTSPETSDRPVGESLANGTSARIAVGIVTVLLKEPFEANLQTLRERFPIKVLSQEDSFSERFVTLEVDFDRLSLGELPEAVQALNQRSEHDPLTDAVFSSINTAKTITLAALLESQALDLIYGVSLRNLGEAEGAIDTQEEIASMPLTDLTRTEAVTKTPPSIPVLASKLWWLDAVKARDAWNYSMGEDATVAIIDSNFAILKKNAERIPSKPDFDNRVIFSQGESYLRNCVLAEGDTLAKREADCQDRHNDEALNPFNQLQHPPGHGLWAASVLASGDNDNDGIVGVAPRAKFVPMFHSSGIEEPIAHQLERLYNDAVHVDVVSMSLSRGVNAYDYYFANKSYQNKFRNPTQPVPILQGKFAKPPEPGKDPDLNPSIERLYRAIYKLSEERKVIFVAAAGNNDKTYDPSLGLSFQQDVRIPACMDQVISVGAYQVENNQPRRAKFDTFTDDEPIGSNYGLLADIFAPGKGIWVQGYEPSGGVFIPSWHVIDGTSFATPIVAGTVALMKSINKNLMFKDVYNILRNKGTKLDHLSFNEGLRSPVDSFGLNSLEAVKAAAGTSPENKAAKTHCLQYLPSLSLLKDVNETVPGSGSVEALFKGQYLPTLVRAESGEYFEVVGWTSRERPGIASNRLETIQYKRSSEALCRAAAGGSGGFTLSAVPNPLPNPSAFYGAQGLIYQGLTTQAYGGQTLAIPVEGNLNNASVRIGETLAEEISTRSDAVLFKLPVNLTPGRYDIHLSTDGGTVTLQAALDYQRSLPNDYVFGLFAKLYANTDVMPVENEINTLTPGGAEPFKPSAVVIVPNLAFNPVRNDAFNVGLPNFYIADIQGTLTIAAGEEGQYDFALLHDDGALVDIDGQRIISAVRYATAPEVISTGSKSLSAGMHTIRVQRYQYTGRDPLILSWRKPNTTEFEVIPLQAFSHPTNIQTSADSQLKPGVLGRFFGDVSAEPPNYPYGSKLYEQINFTDPVLTQGDSFGIGQSDYFAGLFSGYLRLPAGYTAGTYQLVIGHDDGFYFYFDGELKINAPGPTGYIEHTIPVLLEPGKNYPYLLHYHEYTGNAILGFYWVKPDGTRELIPAQAYWR